MAACRPSAPGQASKQAVLRSKSRPSSPASSQPASQAAGQALGQVRKGGMGGERGTARAQTFVSSTLSRRCAASYSAVCCQADQAQPDKKGMTWWSSRAELAPANSERQACTGQRLAAQLQSWHVAASMQGYKMGWGQVGVSCYPTLQQGIPLLSVICYCCCCWGTARSFCWLA